MSYNYLPLDRKWLNFQQVKNLLDYDQLVSITFDAHERILKCTEYLNNVSSENDLKNVGTTEGGQFDKVKSIVVKGGEEVPVDVVKWMLMLKIKSLSQGHSTVQIETVKRLMEMYNNGVLPVIYLKGVLETGENISALTQLSLPVIGCGQVRYNGQKTGSLSVLDELKWQPISLQSQEWQALTTGTHFTTAYALHVLKKTEQLLKVAELIAALSSDVLNYSHDWFDERVHSLNNQKGPKKVASVISSYLAGGSTERNSVVSFNDAHYFSSIAPVHGAARDTFAYVLDVFLKEINSVTETPLIFPDENLILQRGNDNHQPLALALDILSISIAGLANLSFGRINLLTGAQTPSVMPQSIATTSVTEIKQLLSPPSVVDSTAYSKENFSSIGSNAAVKSLQVINNVEKVIAVELIAASKAWELKSPAKTSPFLQEFLEQFRLQCSSVSITDPNTEDLEQVVKFIDSYKQ